MDSPWRNQATLAVKAEIKRLIAAALAKNQDPNGVVADSLRSFRKQALEPEARPETPGTNTPAGCVTPKPIAPDSGEGEHGAHVEITPPAKRPRRGTEQQPSEVSLGFSISEDSLAPGTIDTVTLRTDVVPTSLHVEENDVPATASELPRGDDVDKKHGSPSTTAAGPPSVSASAVLADVQCAALSTRKEEPDSGEEGAIRISQRTQWRVAKSDAPTSVQHVGDVGSSDDGVVVQSSARRRAAAKRVQHYPPTKRQHRGVAVSTSRRAAKTRCFSEDAVAEERSPIARPSLSGNMEVAVGTPGSAAVDVDEKTLSEPQGQALRGAPQVDPMEVCEVKPVSACAAQAIASFLGASAAADAAEPTLRAEHLEDSPPRLLNHAEAVDDPFDEDSADEAERLVRASRAARAKRKAGRAGDASEAWAATPEQHAGEETAQAVVSQLFAEAVSSPELPEPEPPTLTPEEQHAMLVETWRKQLVEGPDTMAGGAAVLLERLGEILLLGFPYDFLDSHVFPHLAAGACGQAPEVFARALQQVACDLGLDATDEVQGTIHYLTESALLQGLNRACEKYDFEVLGWERATLWLDLSGPEVVPQPLLEEAAGSPLALPAHEDPAEAFEVPVGAELPLEHVRSLPLLQFEVQGATDAVLTAYSEGGEALWVHSGTRFLSKGVAVRTKSAVVAVPILTASSARPRTQSRPSTCGWRIDLSLLDEGVFALAVSPGPSGRSMLTLSLSDVIGLSVSEVAPVRGRPRLLALFGPDGGDSFAHAVVHKSAQGGWLLRSVEAHVSSAECIAGIAQQVAHRSASQLGSDPNLFALLACSRLRRALSRGETQVRCIATGGQRGSAKACAVELSRGPDGSVAGDLRAAQSACECFTTKSVTSEEGFRALSVFLGLDGRPGDQGLLVRIGRGTDMPLAVVRGTWGFYSTHLCSIDAASLEDGQMLLQYLGSLDPRIWRHEALRGPRHVTHFPGAGVGAAELVGRYLSEVGQGMYGQGLLARIGVPLSA